MKLLRWRRRSIAAAIVLFSLVGPTFAVGVDAASRSLMRVPFTLAWNIRAPDNAVSPEFLVTEHRSYLIELVCGWPTRDEMKALKTFIGDGTTVWVTKETADSEDPEIVPFEPSDEFRRKHVARMAHSGTMIPVAVRVEELMPDGGSAILLANKIKTWNVGGNASEGLYRPIASIVLLPGRYRMTVSVSQSMSVPAGIATFVRVRPAPNSSILSKP